MDFQRVDQKKKIHMKVPLHFINADSSPGVKTSGGIVSHVFTELDISCLPKDLPEFIEVDLIDLSANNSVHLKDLKMPPRVEIPVLTKGGNPAVATIVIPRAVVSEESAAEETVDAAEIPTTVQKQEGDEKETENKDAGKKK